jgi:hypothetical protein
VPRLLTKLGRRDAWLAAIDLTLICGAFATLIFMNREWLLNQFGGIDQWIYTGYFLHYDIPTVLSANKKIARLPWILSGFSLNQILPPIIASQVLHGTYFLISCIGVYVAIRKLLDRRIALLLALFCLFYIELYGPGGWDYHDVAGGVFYIFSYIALDFAAERQGRPFLPFLAAGVLVALTVHTNIVTINLMPVFVLEVVATLKRRDFVFSQSKKWLAAAALGIVIGATACTGLLGLINLSVGREFIFFADLWSRSTELLLKPDLQQTWWLDWGSLWWAKAEIHMALYGGVLALAVVSLASSVLKHRNLWTDRTNTLFIEYIVAFGIMLGWQLLGQTSLTPNYMAYPLMFPMIFALAALIARIIRDQPGNISVPWACGIALSFYMIYGGTLQLLIERPLEDSVSFVFGQKGFNALSPFLIFTGGFVLLCGLANILRRSNIKRGVAYTILFACVTTVLAATAKELADIGHTNFRNECVIRQPIYSSIIESNRYLFRKVNNRYQMNLWFDGSELLGITNCRVPLHARTVGQPLIFGGLVAIMPLDEMASSVAEIPDETLNGMNPAADVVVIISKTPTPALELADILSKKSGINWRLLRSKAIMHRPIRFTISIVGATEDAITGDERS